MAVYKPSQLSSNQAITYSFDEENNALRVTINTEEVGEVKNLFSEVSSVAKDTTTIIQTYTVPHDSNNASATATVVNYTANPSALGTSVGTVRSTRMSFNNSATMAQDNGFEFGNRGSQSIVLRGTSQLLAVNFGSTSITGSLINITVEWTEE